MQSCNDAPNLLNLDMEINVVEIQLKITHTIHLPGDDNSLYVYGVEDAGNVFCQTIGASNVERAAMLCLDNTNKIINYSVISIGSIDSVKVSVSQIFRTALLSNAVKIIIAHNHPSGHLEVTNEDIDMTRKIGFFARSFGIELIDSIVVTENNAISIREHCKEF